MAISEEKNKRYLELAHSIQCAAGFMIEGGHSNEGTPKHLRTGINMAMCGHVALVKLLVDKGIISEDEYADALIEMLEKELEKELESYKAEAKDIAGADIHFH